MALTNLQAAIIIAIVVIVVAVVGFLATRSSIDSWYKSLKRSKLSPPNSVFGIIWSILYLGIGVSTYIAYSSAKSDEQRQNVMNIFVLQMSLNLMWSATFFGSRSTRGGVLVILALLSAILYNVNYFFSINQVAGWILVPYLLWVSYATLLNVDIVRINPMQGCS